MGAGREQVLLRVFIGEADRHGHRPLYETLVELFRKEGLSGATVLRGVFGFGGHSEFHSAKLLSISADLPMVVEVVDTREKIDAVLPRVEELMDGGLVTLEQVAAIRPVRRRGEG